MCVLEANGKRSKLSNEKGDVYVCCAKMGKKVHLQRKIEGRVRFLHTRKGGLVKRHSALGNLILLCPLMPAYAQINQNNCSATIALRDKSKYTISGSNAKEGQRTKQLHGPHVLALLVAAC